MCSKNNQTNLCGEWTDLNPMNVPRFNFAAASGPDSTATNPFSGLDSDPRVYVFGGFDENRFPTDSGEKYNPNNNIWTPVASLPRPLANCAGAFAPDYSTQADNNLGYIYVVGDDDIILYQYSIRNDEWIMLEDLSTPPVKNATLQYLDDIGGPIPQLLTSITEIILPACTDGQTLWIVGGEETERETWYLNLQVNGLPPSGAIWNKGPKLPLFRTFPLTGRVFWRDTGITSFGVSNCASIIVAGGKDKKNKTRKNIQLLIRNEDCDWEWITQKNNPSQIPDKLLTLAVPVSQGAFGTEPWPETLVTGGRPILFGGKPSNRDKSLGSVQYGQFRFFDGRFQRDPELKPGPSKKSDWNVTTSMPGNRIFFRALPLSQENSSKFGGRRISRFICVGGITSVGSVTGRNQLFELPVPSPFTELIPKFDLF